MKQIPLSRGKFADVDDEDFEYLNRWKWHCLKVGYAARSEVYTENCERKKRLVYMHRLIMNTPRGMEVDHIDGDRLNNKKENLRNVTHHQNLMNQRSFVGSSKFKGVARCKRSPKWQSGIVVNGKRINLGHHATEIGAARAYNEAAIKYFGEFAKLNQL